MRPIIGDLAQRRLQAVYTAGNCVFAGERWARWQLVFRHVKEPISPQPSGLRDNFDGLIRLRLAVQSDLLRCFGARLAGDFVLNGELAG